MKKHDWNPEMYLKFSKERTQPSVDLVSRIDYNKPDSIIDIGCGSGNSTQVLYQKWPDSYIIGVDNSPAMIKRATEDYPDQKWFLFDAGKENMDRKFDIVFSNATIQWIPNHDELIKRFSGLLNQQGILAIQIPLFFDMPVSKSIAEVGNQPKWQYASNGIKELFTIHNEGYYYNLLSKYFNTIDIWVTDYFHIMDSQTSILDMIRTTGLKPYLERITDNKEKQEFENQVLIKIKQEYPSQSDGKVLFPFKRLFFVASNAKLI